MDDLLSIAVSNAVAATILALMALAVAAVSRRPALRHGLWLLVLLKLVTPPLLFLPLSWPKAGEAGTSEVVGGAELSAVVPAPVIEEGEAPAIVPVAAGKEANDVEAPDEDATRATLTQPRSPRPAASQPSLWPPLLSIVWGVGALAWFLLALERLSRFRRLLRFARPASAALQERTRGLAQALGLKRCPRVRLLPGRVAPMLWAIGGPPRLLVPAGLLDLLSDEQLDTLLLHELAHLRRRDHWVRVLEFVVMGLYWWHPVVWYARRELREAEEQCCDAWVVSTLPESGRTYASALLDTLDFLSTAQAAVPPLASGLGQIADLKRRLTMIMRGNTPRSLTWPGCLAVIALGLTFLPMLPSLHGQPPSEDEAKKLQHLQQETQQLRDQARAQVEIQKAQLAAKKAELENAEALLKAAEAQAREFESQAQRRAEMLELAKQEQATVAKGKKKAASRIVITVTAPADAKADEVKRIIGSIQKALPEKLPSGTEVRIVFGAESIVIPTPSKSSETRINDLEKKLEKVLREVHELRKQMQPHGGPAYVPPSSPVPAGTVAPPYPGNPSLPAPATPPPAGSATPAPSAPYRLVPAPAAPRHKGKSRPEPTPPVDPRSSEDPYDAPTVPLKNAPVDPTRP